MTSNVMHENYNVNFSFENNIDKLYFGASIVMVIITIIVIGILISEAKSNKIREIKVSIAPLIFVCAFLIICTSWSGIGIFAPAHVTKTTQILKENSPVVQVEGKLLSENGLTFYIKKDDGSFDKKYISVYGDSEIKEEGTSYKYETVTTKVDYRVKTIGIVPSLRVLPNKRTIEKINVTVPKGSLTNKK